MKTMALVMLGSLSWLLGCEVSHSDSNSSGSNWLRCQELADCKVPEAVGCNAQGYCMDQNGERIAALASDMKDDEGCAFSVDAILAEAKASSGDRQACGSFDLDSTDEARAAGQRCFDQAREDGRAAELTVTRCIDCWMPDTYVTTEGGDLYEVFQREDSDENVREALLKSCDRIAFLEDRRDFSCENAAILYQCIEPVSAMPPNSTLQTPFKLSDAPNPENKPTVIVHLYASNQSFDEPLTSFFVRIDEKRVILGDFAVKSQHNWYGFDIAVPLGTHRLDVHGNSGAVFTQDIDISGERWLAIDYWFTQNDALGRHFTLNESDTQLVFAARSTPR